MGFASLAGAGIYFFIPHRGCINVVPVPRGTADCSIMKRKEGTDSSQLPLLHLLLLRERLHAEDWPQLAGGERFDENGTDRLLQHLAKQDR